MSMIFNPIFDNIMVHSDLHMTMYSASNQPAVMHKCNVCRWLHYKHWFFLVCIPEALDHQIEYIWHKLKGFASIFDSKKRSKNEATLMATITWW